MHEPLTLVYIDGFEQALHHLDSRECRLRPQYPLPTREQHHVEHRSHQLRQHESEKQDTRDLSAQICGHQPPEAPTHASVTSVVNTYPPDRTVWISTGSFGSFSILRR